MVIAFKVGHIMSKNLISVKSNASVSEIASTMIQHNVGAVVVMDADTPKGVITEVDILKKCCVGKTCNSGELRAENIMSTPLKTIDANAAIGEAAKKMSDEKIRRLLVTEKRRNCRIGHRKGCVESYFKLF